MKRAKPKGIAAANKKRKAEEAEALSGSPFSEELFADASVATAAAAFASACPVKYVVLTAVCKEARLRTVFEKALHGLSADLSESDNSKVYQGGKLTTINEDDPQLTQVRVLRDALYSDEMRRIVAEVVKCGELSDTVDCGISIYNEGCHLLPHELLSHSGRRVAFFLFITPDEEWCDADGATLDLYCSAESGAQVDATAAARPFKSILPNWNTMVLLDVDERFPPVVGLSEVVSEDKTLMCLAGWYHLQHPAHSVAGGNPRFQTLQVPHQQVFRDVTVSGSSTTLSESDRDELGKYIAPQHLQAEAIERICKDFEEDSAALLRDFLLPSVMEVLSTNCRHADTQDAVGYGRRLAHAAGVSPLWHMRGPPNKQRYLQLRHAPHSAEAAQPEHKPGKGATGVSEATGTAGDEAGALLATLRDELVGSDAFARYLSALTGLEVTHTRAVARRFRAGLDYCKPSAAAAANFSPSSSAPGASEMSLDATLCVVDERDDQPVVGGTGYSGEGRSAETTGANLDVAPVGALSGGEKSGMWRSCLVGGYQCYIEYEDDAKPFIFYSGGKRAPTAQQGSGSEVKADEKEGSVSEVRPDEEEGDASEEDGALAHAAAEQNVLFLALRDEGVASMVKYVSACAPGSRWDLALESKLRP